ncbi:MAG: iron ABC transporter permease [Firmicutes bacterium]|nr:iron ABC transporter permease [Bacillota bacterium]
METKSATQNGKRERIAILILSVLLFVLFIFSFVIGRYDVPVTDVIKILLSRVFPITQNWTSNMETAVINIRLPRILLACLVGCCLATAGTSYQSVFQNPMAAPDILGASSGACFGAALAILFDFSKMGITLTAFFFSILTVTLVYIIGARIRGNQIVNILLAGIMVSSLFSAGTSYIKLVADPSNQLPAITYWLMGSLSGTRLKDVGFAVIPMLIGLAPIFLIRWRMNLLTINEEEAKSMGVNTKLLRFAVIVCATFITAASVACSGMIGWVGLVIPHLSRKIVGNNCRYLIPASMIFGAFFLLLVDNISRNLLATEIPIGILTAFIGAPFFIYLMMQKENH